MSVTPLPHASVADADFVQSHIGQLVFYDSRTTFDTDEKAMTTASGDLAALAQRGYRFALALTHDRTSAADLVQDAWLAVLVAGGPWTDAYLFAAVRNRFIDRCRRDKRIRFEPLPEEPVADHESNGPMEDEGGFDVSPEILNDALAVLSAEERGALYLAAVEGYGTKQLSELLQRPPGTVMSMMHRARRRLRDALAAGSRLKT